VLPSFDESSKLIPTAPISATFKTYEKVGHWTTSKVNLDVILFFLKELNKNN